MQPQARLSVSVTDTHVPGDDSTIPKGKKRSSTVRPEPVTDEERAEYTVELQWLSENYPKTRADCVDMEGPCPFVGCRFNLYLDTNESSGSMKINFPDLDFDDLEETCALNMAKRSKGGSTLEDVGQVMNLTRERVRQIEAKALARLQSAGVFIPEDAVGLGHTVVPLDLYAPGRIEAGDAMGVRAIGWFTDRRWRKNIVRDDSDGPPLDGKGRREDKEGG